MPTCNVILKYEPRKERGENRQRDLRWECLVTGGDDEGEREKAAAASSVRHGDK